MSKEEHISLAMNIKNIHKDLRKLSAKIGPENAWEIHMKDEVTRNLYAKSMKLLAEIHWKKNSSSEGCHHRGDSCFFRESAKISRIARKFRKFV